MPENPTETVEVKGKQIQVGVKFILINPEKKILLLKRSPEKYPGLGDQWDVPGGRMKPKVETIKQAGKREVFAETQLEPTGKYRFLKKQRFSLRPDGPEVTRLTYLASAEGNPILSEEHTEFLWATLEQANNLNLDPYLKDVIKELTT